MEGGNNYEDGETAVDGSTYSAMDGPGRRFVGGRGNIYSVRVAVIAATAMEG